MSDHLQINVSVMPIEELTEENLGTRNILASEIGTTIGGKGTSVDLANYQGSAASQGYLNRTVNYMDAVHTAGGGKLSTIEPCDAVVIKNTGYKYSDATTLGAATTDCVAVAYKTLAYSAGVQSGWMESGGDTAQDHYFMIAWLKPGQAAVLTNQAITNFGGNSYDISQVNHDAADYGDAQIYCRTFASNGAEASDGNAVEFLCVT